MHKNDEIAVYLTGIEVQAVIDALLYTQQNTVVSNAHGRVMRKAKKAKSVMVREEPGPKNMRDAFRL